MKVLFSTPTYTPFVSGTSTFVEAMARRLLADGHEAMVLTTNARQASDFWDQPAADLPRPRAQETLDGVRVERLALTYPWPSPYVFGLLRRAGLWLQVSPALAGLKPAVQRSLARWMPPLLGVREALQKWGPQVDVIHATESSWDGLLLASVEAARRYKKPLVITPLMHLGSRWVQAAFQMPHQIAAYRAAGAVLALSAQEAEAYARLGVSPERIHIIRMGVDLPTPTSVNPRDAEQFRAEHALRGPLVAFVGANTYDKGAFALASAVIQLNLAGTYIDMVCAGPLSESLQTFVQEQSPGASAIARERIHILGEVDDLTKQRLLAACDLLALPSQVDTFGIVLLEAWLYGKPIVGAAAGGIPALVEHEKNGLLVPFGDVAALAAAVQRLLDDPALAARLGAAGQDALPDYTWHQTYHTLLGVYQGVLNEGEAVP